MQTVSTAFLKAIQSDHVVVSKVEVLDSSGVIFSVQSDDHSDARILNGSVTMAKASATRSTSKVTLVDPTGNIVPTSAGSVFTPYGHEIRLWRGVKFNDGTTEFVKLCTNRISDVEIDESDGGMTVAVTGYGRERQVARNVVATYWPTTSTLGWPLTGISYASYIRTLITDRYPRAQFNGDVTAWTNAQWDPTWATPVASPVTMSEGADPWGQAKNMADSVMTDLYADRDGTFNMIRDPNLALLDASSPINVVASFVEGSTATFTTLKRKLSDTNTFNQVIVSGEATVFGLPFRSAPAQDNDANSPTYINGPYGIVTHTETSPFLYTQSQVDNFAALVLKRSLGLQETVEISGMVNPALDVDDPILITRTRAGMVKINYIIDSVTIPLGAADSMTLKTRERRSLA